MNRSKIFLVLVFLFPCALLMGQKNSNELKFNVAAEIPVGKFGDSYKTGFGFHVTDYFGVTDKGSLLLNAGYNKWKTGSSNRDVTGSIINVRVGYRYKLPSGVYLEAAPGLAIFGDVFGEGSRFAFGIGGGYLIKTGSKGAVDLFANFNNTSYGGTSLSWIGLGAGYLVRF